MPRLSSEVVKEKSSYVLPIYVGIDPGMSGGLALIADYGLRAEKMRATERDLWQWVRLCNAGDGRVFAVIERVTGYVGDGGNTGSSQFKFGTNYGLCRMALVAAGIPFEEVGAAQWQRALGIPTKAGKTRTEHKNILKQRAQQLFPSAGITLATADAVLIAEYCRRKRTGLLGR